MSKLQDAFFIGVITIMVVGTFAINKAQAADLPQTQTHQAVYAKAYKVRGKTYTPLKSVAHFAQTGTASWYGPDFHGKKTSNGEIYNMHGLTAAHRTLPLGTQIRVTNTSNGKSVVVRVNDRGPFHGNRVIDLSKGAAQQLGFLDKGMANVKIETLTPKPNTAADNFMLAENKSTSPKAENVKVSLPEKRKANKNELVKAALPELANRANATAPADANTTKPLFDFPKDSSIKIMFY